MRILASIATAGNSFARVQAISNYSPYWQEDYRLSLAVSQARAKFYRDIDKLAAEARCL